MSRSSRSRATKLSNSQKGAIRTLTGSPIPGYNAIVNSAGAAAHALKEGAEAAYNGIMHDPYVHYEGMNDYALQGLQGGPSWAQTYASMRVPLQNLPPDRLAILRGVLAGSGVNADNVNNTSPAMQMIALRGLNPQNARLG